MSSTDSTAAAYAAFAPVYDSYNASNDYESWIAMLLPFLEDNGLGKRGTLLDVGCGTGMAVGPMLKRGWKVVACDLSTEMVKEAERKFPAAGIRFHVCDMRSLPFLGTFDLVWALNDPVGYLVEDNDLLLALRSMKKNLAAGGVLVFDCNTRRLFREAFKPGVEEVGGGRWRWQGFGNSGGDCFAAEISGDGVVTHRHELRYRPVDEVREALAEAGLKSLQTVGQEEVDGMPTLSPAWSEERDHKVLHIAGIG